MRESDWLKPSKPLKAFILAVYGVSVLLKPFRSKRCSSRKQRIVYIAPFYFDEESLVGGGERYVAGLAMAMAECLKTVCVSFGKARKTFFVGKARFEIYPIKKNPFDPRLLAFVKELLGADIVHCHQYRYLIINVAIAMSAVFGKKVVVTDHAGFGSNYVDHIPLHTLVDRFLAVSRFSLGSLPSKANSEVIYAGVGENFIERPVPAQKKQNVLFVGRIMPHKGINYLIEALREDMRLDVVGRVYDEEYFVLLKDLARNKRVTFILDADDEALARKYEDALVTVLPSVYEDVYGRKHRLPELLGLSLLESMSCATPVICTNVGGMPEVVREGVNGFVVAPNDPHALAERLTWFFNNPEKAREMGQNGRNIVRDGFTWDHVAARCAQLYFRES